MSCRDSEVHTLRGLYAAGVVIVIPTYRPPQSVHSIINELDGLGPIVVSDDASPATFDPLLRRLASDGIRVIHHDENRGIARALNDGLRVAREVGAEWLMTLDQDSWIDRHQAERLVHSAQEQQQRMQGRLGVIGPGDIILQGGASLYRSLDEPISQVPEVIQSGALWSVQALLETGAFSQRLTMDAVDAEACLGLRERGFSVLVDRDISLHHKLGETRPVRIFGKQVLVTHHTPKRLAHMRRNRMALFAREFKQSPANAFRTLRRIALNEILTRSTRR